MESLFGNLLAMLLSGGPHAISALLLLGIALLLIDRRRLVSDINRKDEKIDKMIDDYYKGNVTIADAMNSLKNALMEIRNRISP